MIRLGKDPAFLLYSGDFLSGITDLTFEERGQYITLLCVQHQKGRLSEKTCRLVLGLENLSDAADVMKKFEIDADGRYFNRRLESEIKKRASSASASRENGKLGGRPPKPKNNLGENLQVSCGLEKPEPRENLGEDENENRNRDVDVVEDERPSPAHAKPSVQEKRFTEFWAAYPRKAGKQAALKAWGKIKPDAALHAKIMAAVEQQKRSAQWKRDAGQYIPHPTTWLNQGRWEDELPADGQRSSGKGGNVFLDIAKDRGYVSSD